METRPAPGCPRLSAMFDRLGYGALLDVATRGCLVWLAHWHDIGSTWHVEHWY